MRISDWSSDVCSSDLFLMQSELSQAPSRAQRDMPYRDLDVDAGVEHMQLMGVRYYLARTPEAQAAAEANPALTEIATDGPWVVYEVADADLVAALDPEPVVTTAAGPQDAWHGRWEQRRVGKACGGTCSSRRAP